MSLFSNILFLKEKDELYTQQSVNFGYESYYQPVLQETYENEITLTRLLQNPVNYWGLIFTSKRSSQSFKKVYLSLTEEIQADLNQLLLFSVGQKTSECIEALGLTAIGSDTTGYGIKLAKLVKEKYDTLEIKHKRLLFLTGDKNRVELPNYLIENNIEFEKLRVYRTEPNQRLSLEFSKLSNEVEGNFRWLAFFSPSGVDACLEIFKNEKTKNCKIAAIGNTTADYLKKVGIAVHAIASKPEPKALLEAIKEFDIKN
ncbi:tetrapyrrole biosynthesis, uroporphyrinogen III synthase [Neoconidiobolus thromboides FSU 785]|nr:tetrapyrrole biosynthesis, uroporphyrinogen III synthase [Neoconidiobolus thromboides FSU 785]